ncbi:MAG: class I SAM-dependent methyltransferase [Gordonia sp. (in: high G+C Gram-positive bacteria)]|jgi:ubiquinone/menaquinone biosynthesis C-methylase UbiE|nr:class I SAM-dependent methyltransferase [Gordonia sp. (in: high G+C Gram-positive bacteria)]
MVSIAQRLMAAPVFSQVYERAWRPLFTRGFSLGASDTTDYDNALRSYLGRPGERTVLDIACGPGNYSRDASRGLTGDGRYIGIDFSQSMVEQAVRDHRDDRVTFLRGDAHHLPFADDTFDTVMCLAALYLIPDPMPVLDEMVRVCRPGGEAIIFTTSRTSIAALPGAGALTGLSGLKIFGVHEITRRFTSLGMDHVEQTITGVGQFVHARKPH